MDKDPPSRAPSFAYPQTHRTLSIISKIQLYLRQHSRAVLATLSFFIFMLFITSDYAYEANVRAGSLTSSKLRGSHNPDNNFGGAWHTGYFSIQDSIVKDGQGQSFLFAAVSDLDQLSHVKDSKKPLFHSIFVMGKLTFDPKANTYSIKFQKETRNLITKHNEAGRGAEFSELTSYQDRLFTFDDRSGDVFEVLNKKVRNENDKNNYHIESFVVPRFVITEGNGDTDKGMKWEWATVKHDTEELYMGSMGKEYTNPDGSIANTNNLWIAILDRYGEIRREDWTKQYSVVRKALGASSPGYLIHEAVNWSEYLQKWVFLPRRVSSDPYDETVDERKGSNKLVLVDDNFSKTTVVEINMSNTDPLHGFSTFAFVPNTNDRHALAIRSVEEDCVGGDDDICKQRSYFVVFDVLTGDVLMDEVKYDGAFKLEGVEFVDWNAVPSIS